MRAVLLPFLLAAGIVSTGEAQASGGIGCEGRAGKTKFSIQSGVTRGMGSPVFQFAGTIETTEKAIQPDLRKVRLNDDQLAQYWLDGKELRMVLYKERATGDHGYVELTMLTKSVGEGSYAGRFDILYYETKGDASGEGKTLKAAGKVSCFVE